MPVRHGGYRTNLVMEIIARIRDLPGASDIINALKRGEPDAVKMAYHLAKLHGDCDPRHVF